MKRFLLITLVAISIVNITTSCSSDSEIIKPTIDGEWRTLERTFISEQYPEKTKLINEALREHLKKYELVRSFPPQTQEQLSPDTIKGEFKFTATLPGADAPTRSVDGIYRMASDSILLFDRITNSVARLNYNVGEKILITYQKMNKEDLILLFDEIETYVILPEDITGVLKTKDVR